VFGKTEQPTTKSYNPFLNKNGELINPFLNYQKLLDRSDISQKAKYFITQATGLTPTVTAPTVTTPTTSTPTPNNIKPSNNNIVSAAQKYIGTPYVWGGESMDEGGMDCSGFVYNALKDAGYNIGRTTAQGYRSQGTVVNKSDMQAGDLIFFGSNKNDASHIGIYIGDGKMVHSSGGSKNTKANPGKGVTVTDVNYRNDFIEARRY
jgi:cell wall-associated NlpC family hydrolase